MLQSIDLVVGETYHAAYKWCTKNGIDVRLACSDTHTDRRLKGLRNPHVIVVGDVHGLPLLAQEVEIRGGTLSHGG